MTAVAASLSHSNTSSVIWDARRPQFPPVLPLHHIAVPSKSGSPAFLVDVQDANASRCRKMRLQLARASHNAREILQNVEHQSLGQNEIFRSPQGAEDQQTQVDEDTSSADVVRSTTDQEAVTETNSTVAESKTDEESISSADSEEGELLSGDAALKGSIVAGVLLIGAVGGFGAVSYLYREQINDFLIQFSDFIEGYGAAGYALFVAVYAGLEILAIPAIPLTMSAGLLFGTLTGTIIVSISGTIAATAAFLIARYLARDRILKLAEGNKKFLAIDKAIGENGFRIVTLLRLSPLLPFSLGNYLYGLTSVKLVPYILGSWLGMLPGTWAYVSAGAVGRVIIQQEAENGLNGGSEQLWTVGAGLLVTVFAATYVTRLAKDAIKDME